MQAALFTLLAFAVARSIITKSTAWLLLMAHLGSVSLLMTSHKIVLNSWSLPIEGDYWLVLTKTIVAVSVLACYRQLSRLPAIAPAMDKIIIFGCILAIGLIIEPIIYPLQRETLVDISQLTLLFTIATLTATISYHLYRKTITTPSLFISALLSATLLSFLLLSESNHYHIPLLVQAVLLSVLYWHFNQSSHQKITTLAINKTVPARRPIFEAALREHLQKPQTPLKTEDIPERVLSTFKAVLPHIPANIISYKDKECLFPNSTTFPTDDLINDLPGIRQEMFKVIELNQEAEITVKDNKGQKTFWLFPLDVTEDEQILLILTPGNTHSYDQQWQTACDLASHARTLYYASKQSRFWEKQASLDPLTGLLNRKAFFHQANHLFQEECAEKPPECSLLFLDVDNFKQLNDTYGHQAGDDFLIEMAKLCRHKLRQQDMICRYGGEEFVVLLPGTTPQQGWKVAERLRQSVQQHLFTANGLSCTVSIGISSYNSENTRLEKSLQDADRALYQSKAQGKNCISFTA
ncbi:GGDEF domain-containing protein [Endozoicomonas sp. Mp262]|uniref:GGDEF domain-containing protein n=1 Tax=Endozoicomonas sp. Mp262 TaxID=2919499 RepID=UPI0021D8825A